MPGKPGTRVFPSTRGQSLTAVLRSPSATRLSGQFGPRLNGFASLPHDRFAFFGAITLKNFSLRTTGERFVLHRIDRCLSRFNFSGQFDVRAGGFARDLCE